MLLVAGGCLVGVNAWQRVADTNAIEREAFGGRVAIETVGQLVAAGEPAIDGLRLKNDLGIGMGGVLTVADLQGLPGRRLGARPAAAVGRARGGARAPAALPAGVGGSRRRCGARRCSSRGEAPDGCVEVRPGGARRFTVAAAGEFSLEAAGRDWPTPVELAWQDAFGEFSQETAS